MPNPYHDPKTGEFTSAGGGGSSGRRGRGAKVSKKAAKKSSPKNVKSEAIKAIDAVMAEYRAKRRAAGLPTERGRGATSGKAYQRKMDIIDKVMHR